MITKSKAGNTWVMKYEGFVIVEACNGGYNYGLPSMESALASEEWGTFENIEDAISHINRVELFFPRPHRHPGPVAGCPECIRESKNVQKAKKHPGTTV